MALKFHYFFLLILLLLGCQNTAPEFEINYQTVPKNPSVFASKYVSTGLSERDFALSPDKSILLYTVQSPKGNFSTIMICKKNSSGKYSKPQIAPFSGTFSDLEPFFHPSKNELFFASNRPKRGNEVYFEEDYDIWKVAFSDKGFGQPERLPENINTYLNEFYPAVTNSGNLYFTSARAFGLGKEDIFLSRFVNGKYETPFPLDSNINTEVYEFNAFVNPTEDLIIFSSFGRLKGPGKGDLYFAEKDKDGNWKKALLFREPINSKFLDFCPFYDESNQILYFSSERSMFENPKKFNSSDSLFTFYNLPGSGLSDIYWVKWTR